MVFCKYCGKKLLDDSRFCTYCGAPQFAEEKQEEASVLEKQADKDIGKKRVPKEKKIYHISEPKKKIYRISLIAIAVLVIAFLSAKKILTDIYSPENVTKQYIEAIRNQDIESFKELTVIYGGGYDETGAWVDRIENATITDEEIQAFLTTVSSNEDMLTQYYNDLITSIAYVEDINLNARRGMLYIQEESKNLFYTSYKIAIDKPVVTINSNMEGAVLHVAGQEVLLHITGTKISLLPGSYEYSAVYKAENVGTEIKVEPNVMSVVYGDNTLDVPFQYTAVHIYREDELFALKEIYINDVLYTGDLTSVMLVNGLDISPIPVSSTIRVVVTAYDKELQHTFNVADYPDGMVLLQPDLWQEIKDEAIATATDATGLYLRISEAYEEEACDEFEAKYKATSKKLVKQIKKDLKEMLKVDTGYHTIDNLAITDTALDNIKYYADRIEFTTHIYYDGEWVYHPKRGKKKISGDPQPIDPYLRVYVVFEYANGTLSMIELRTGHY